MRAETARAGSALLEVVVATVLLATAGVGLANVLGQTARTMRDVEASEARMQRAQRLLDDVSMWGDSLLAERVGRTRVDSLVLDVSTSGAGLFDATVATSDTGLVLLRTTFYRRPGSDAAR